MEGWLALVQEGSWVVCEATTPGQDGENVGGSCDISAEGLINDCSGLLKGSSVAEVIEVGSQQLDRLTIGQGGCRLLSKLQFVEPESAVRSLPCRMWPLPWVRKLEMVELIAVLAGEGKFDTSSAGSAAK